MNSKKSSKNNNVRVALLYKNNKLERDINK